jgi:hypothetical protein
MPGGCPAQGDVRPWCALGQGLLCSSGLAGPSVVLVSLPCPLAAVLSPRAHATESVTTPHVRQTISIASRLRSNNAIRSAQGWV